MERKKYLSIILLLCPLLLLGNTYSDRIYRAYAKGDMTLWKTTMDEMQAAKNPDNRFSLELLNYQYGYIGWLLSIGEKDQAKQHLKQSQTIIKRLEEASFNLSMVYAYKAAFVGFEIGIHPYKAPFIGPDSYDYVEKSLAYNPDNYFAHLQKANIQYHTPALFGGSKQEALKHLLKALTLYEQTPQEKKDWNRLNMLGSLIVFYTEQKDYSNAKRYCEKALTLEPDFAWVKNELYPQTLEKIKK